MACFKSHKEVPCQAAPHPGPVGYPRASKPFKKKKRAADEDNKPAFIVTQEQYARLGQSEQVRKLLSDARMREVCREIVEQGERRLKQALKDQDFAAKINEILQVIGVRDEEGRFIL